MSSDSKDRRPRDAPGAPIPNLPCQLIELLDGFSNTYVVGGTVRDLLRGRSPADIDVATGENPEVLSEVLARRSSGRRVVFSKGDATVFRVVTPAAGIFDISGFSGKSLADDLANRDFTINAMAMAPQSGNITDPLGGASDLRAGRLILASSDALANDPARLIRAFRLCAEFDLNMPPETTSQVASHAERIAGVPGERIRQELVKLLATPRAAGSLRMMAETGLLQHLLPPWEDLSRLSPTERLPVRADRAALETVAQMESHLTGKSGGREWRTTMQDPSTGMCKLGVLLSDVGRPAARRRRPLATPGDPGAIPLALAVATPILHRLRLSRKEQSIVTTMVKTIHRPRGLFEAERSRGTLPVATTRFFMAAGDLTPMVLLAAQARYEAMPAHRCSPSGVGYIPWIQRIRHRYDSHYLPRRATPPLVTGKDLAMRLGLPPGPGMGRILAALRRHQLAGLISTPDAAMALAGDLSK